MFVVSFDSHSDFLLFCHQNNKLRPVLSPELFLEWVGQLLIANRGDLMGLRGPWDQDTVLPATLKPGIKPCLAVAQSILSFPETFPICGNDSV